jgi:hypothetical protein
MSDIRYIRTEEVNFCENFLVRIISFFKKTLFFYSLFLVFTLIVLLGSGTATTSLNSSETNNTTSDYLLLLISVNILATIATYIAFWFTLCSKRGSIPAFGNIHKLLDYRTLSSAIAVLISPLVIIVSMLFNPHGYALLFYPLAVVLVLSHYFTQVSTTKLVQRSGPFVYGYL